MLESRRHALDALRRGPALFAGLPGDEVDLDRLAAHLVRRRIQASIYVTDGSLEGLLWFHPGAPGEAWFFEAGGADAVLPVTSSRDLLWEIASRGGQVSVFLGAPPPIVLAEVDPSAPVVEGGAPPDDLDEPPGSEPEVELEQPWEAEPTAEPAEPSAQPWPAILAEVMARVIRQRGPRLGAHFADALARALAPYGGYVEDGRVVAPPLTEADWRGIVEAGCVPVVSVAGRAFVERTIASAERAVQEARGDAGEAR
jgi:hypothetical protein